jgi:hypothetical protein
MASSLGGPWAGSSASSFNGRALMNVNSYIQRIIIGVIIVLAIAFDTFAQARRRKVYPSPARASFWIAALIAAVARLRGRYIERRVGVEES